MADFFEQVEDLWKHIKGHGAPLPAVAAIPPEDCRPDGSAGARIRRDEDYFTLRVNEMHLGANHQWHKVYDPMVLVVTEFNHDKQRVTVPCVVGPNLVRKQTAGQNPVHGSLVLDTRVAGPFPYRGGDIDISISFYQVERADHARVLLNVIERLSDSVGGALQLGMVAKTGAALLEGVEGLLGLKGTVMLTGHRLSLATSPLDPLKTGFCAMLAPPVPADRSALAVYDRRLHLRDAASSSFAPYRDSDYVLLGIDASTSRDDEGLHRFFEMKTDALNALWDGGDGMARAKANLITAYQQMLKSPDIVTAEARTLFRCWLDELEEEAARVEQVRTMPVTKRHTPENRPLTSFASDLGDAMRQIERRLAASRLRSARAVKNFAHLLSHAAI
jgi:hypothetical protein